ncbi:MAG: hypothetical protein EZS28_033333 [Streblomastix strix]|uniref:Uncharacterized protein n=1 Tax=Streblomastix strix TaxID=222440 RepID=A0A5J4UM68_9EUKA|nr:MAG: hypothetical protein EZS28_033333 [Streblomastix strix]
MGQIQNACELMLPQQLDRDESLDLNSTSIQGQIEDSLLDSEFATSCKSNIGDSTYGSSEDKQKEIK